MVCVSCNCLWVECLLSDNQALICKSRDFLLEDCRSLIDRSVDFLFEVSELFLRSLMEGFFVDFLRWCFSYVQSWVSKLTSE